MRQAGQSVDRQDKFLAHAVKTGTLDELFWFIEMDLPSRLRGTDGHRYAVMEHPFDWVQVVPLGDGIAASMIAIELYVLACDLANAGKKIDFYPALVHASNLEGCAHYSVEQYLSIDHICMGCGSVVSEPAQRDESEPIVCPLCSTEIICPHKTDG